jgi:hypothetical protein
MEQNVRIVILDVFYVDQVVPPYVQNVNQVIIKMGIHVKHVYILVKNVIQQLNVQNVDMIMEKEYLPLLVLVKEIYSLIMVVNV